MVSLYYPDPMRRRLQWALPLILPAAFGSSPGCGKRADPLAPYVKTPQQPSGLELSQVGDAIEIRVTAPRATSENRPLPVIELEWLQAPATGDFGKVAEPILREEVAPGETRTKHFPIPVAAARYSVRAYDGKARSTPPAPVAFKPAPIPTSPTDVQALNTSAGVELRWINPPGAEPWPSATPFPTPSPSPPPPASPGTAGLPIAGAAPSPAPAESPSPTASPADTPHTVPDLPLPAPFPTEGPSSVPLSVQTPTPPPGASKVPGTEAASHPLPARPASPTPAPTIPTGIRIIRTDGTPRLASPPLQASSWLDASPKPDEKPCYSLSYATSFKPLVESAHTEPVCVEVKDLVPPEPPARPLGDLGETFVELSWLASPSGDVDFYRVYRTADWEARAMVIQTEGLLLRVRDLRMTPGPRTYEVTAVDKGGNESQPSQSLKIIVP